MLIISVFALGLIGICIVLLAPVLVRLLKSCSADELTAEWLSNFDPSAYYPMHGLLASEDFQFLARQPGFDFALHRKLRRERMLIFRQYLGRLISDFNRLHLYARLCMAQSQQDRSDQVICLAVLKCRFAISVFRAEYSYYLCLMGIGSLATYAVVARLEDLFLQLHLEPTASA